MGHIARIHNKNAEQHQRPGLLSSSIRTANVRLRLGVLVSRFGSRGRRRRRRHRNGRGGFGRRRRRDLTETTFGSRRSRRSRGRGSRGSRGGSSRGGSGGLPLHFHTPLPLKNHLGPELGLAASRGSFAHRIGQDLHPSVLVGCAVSVEINHFAVAEANTEPFLHEHITFLFLSKRRLATATTPGGGLFLHQRRSVINQLDCLRKVDRGTWLTGGLVVGGQFGSLKLKEATTPVLCHRHQQKPHLVHLKGDLPGSHHPAVTKIPRNYEQRRSPPHAFPECRHSCSWAYPPPSHP
ncbi:uncharacterized protein BO66DRAFT_81488 [Aspergillus aculeatinus CBS 121060]|uniref:Uncharacterized protein n=1 Tax=Aspergillus aculeatinus CBS 121060 TaxID=1448322 RepID=A0ACD1H9V5_9EURO|nr:hypothetical protein BO66DRAFT_81488 [Aspergillus aculeatinus CBS 121060]RAH70444.1 hypothetical protein BO66DRAFT_81488 [Aspergillus aculeatinus CBS 121060]